MTIYSNFFSYIPFWLQQYITTHSSVGFFRETGFRTDSLFSILKIYRILLNVRLLHIY